MQGPRRRFNLLIYAGPSWIATVATPQKSTDFLRVNISRIHVSGAFAVQKDHLQIAAVARSL
jgi:hypothetical protein